MNKYNIYKNVKKYASSQGMLYVVLFLFMAASLLAAPPQDDRTRRNQSQQNRPTSTPERKGNGVGPKAQPVLQVEDETIPDSLLHPRWKIQKTAPIEVADLDSSSLDLHLPSNIRQQVEYDDSLDVYRIGSKMGDSYLNAPILMTPEEYRLWSEKKEREAFFRKKDAENVASKGKDKFSFADMHFDL
jgi:hypothetical protein